MNGWILISNKPTKCNKDILNFLHNNIYIIKKKYKLKIVIVYDDKKHILKNKITKLPILIFNNGASYTGINSIIKTLLPLNSSKQLSNNINIGTDLESYWKEEMGSKEDNENGNGKLMDEVLKKTLEIKTERSNKSANKSSKSSNISADLSANVSSANLNESNISDMVGDPIMQKFWANQESTPGF
jgi:hypothetical protein